MSSYWSKWRRLHADVAIITGKCYSQKNIYDLSEDVKTVDSISKSAFLFQRDELPFSANTANNLVLNPLVVETLKDNCKDKLENRYLDESLYNNKCKINNET